MICDLSRQQLLHTCSALSATDLIRLVSEIDDHGAIPVGALARTLPDLSTRQIRETTEHAQTLGLLIRTPGGVALSTAGQDLADIYDATARWARRHSYPTALFHFAGRIQNTFTLLAAPEHDAQDSGGLRDGLDRLRRLVAEWAHTHQCPHSPGGAAA